MDYTSFLNESFGDYFSPNKEEEITVISANINSLRMEEWKAKNDVLREFFVQSEADIIALQETNVNWTKVS